jgi:VCBS repeat-containing protein
VLRQNARFSANMNISFLPLLGFAACGSIGNESSPENLPTPTAASDSATIKGMPTAAVTGNVLSNDVTGTSKAALSVSTIKFGASSATAGQDVAGSLGTLTLKSDGSYSYTLTDATAVQALGAGQSLEESFSYTAGNKAGTTTSTLVFKFTGANDAPVAVDDSLTLAAGTFSGIITPLANDSDVDKNAVLKLHTLGTTGATANIVVAGTYGSFTVQANGSVLYTIDPKNTAYLALQGGQTAVDSIAYVTRDDQGAESTANLNVTVTGQNEGPQAALIVKEFNLDSYNSYAYIQIGSNAIDYEGDSNFVLTALGGNAIERVIDTDPYAGASPSPWRYLTQKVVTDYGDFFVYGDDTPSRTIATPASIAFSVNSNNAELVALKAGEIKDVSVSYTLRDSSGASAEASATVRIVGRDDAPIFKPDFVVPTVSAATPSVTIKLADIIVDPEGERTTIKEISYYSSFTGQTITTSAGSYTINADASITYTLNVDSYGYKAASPTLTYYDGISFKATDGEVETSLYLYLKVVGVNDAPIANNIREQMNFDQANANVYVLQGVDDPDTGDILTISNIAGQALPSATTLTSAAGMFTASYNSNNILEVSVNRSNVAAANLAYGALLTDVFSYTVKDAAGASSSANLTVTLTGTKQTPTTGNDVIYLTQLTDSFDGLSGNDRFVMNEKRSSQSGLFNGQNDMIVGGAGSDTLDFRTSYSNTPIVIDLTKTTPIKFGNSAEENTTVSGVENVYGTYQNDTLYGSSDANILYGANGNDALYGLAGNDILIGGGSIDTATGGAGDDLIIAETADGGAQNDLLVASGSDAVLLRGGSGADSFILANDIYSYGSFNVHIADFSHAENDKIDLSILRKAVGGTALTLQDILDHSSIVGDSVQINLDSFETNGNQVRGSITLDGVSSTASLVAGDFIFSGGVDWQALVPTDI